MQRRLPVSWGCLVAVPAYGRRRPTHIHDLPRFVRGTGRWHLCDSFLQAYLERIHPSLTLSTWRRFFRWPSAETECPSRKASRAVARQASKKHLCALTGMLPKFFPDSSSMASCMGSERSFRTVSRNLGDGLPESCSSRETGRIVTASR